LWPFGIFPRFFTKKNLATLPWCLPQDKLAWDIEPDMNGDTLRIRLIHKDAKNIPRNHIR
jgi:hypothetical protein